jgi:hypothetical protein
MHIRTGLAALQETIYPRHGTSGSMPSRRSPSPWSNSRRPWQVLPNLLCCPSLHSCMKCAWLIRSLRRSILSFPLHTSITTPADPGSCFARPVLRPARWRTSPGFVSPGAESQSPSEFSLASSLLLMQPTCDAGPGLRFSRRGYYGGLRVQQQGLEPGEGCPDDEIHAPFQALPPSQARQVYLVRVPIETPAEQLSAALSMQIGPCLHRLRIGACLHRVTALLVPIRAGEWILGQQRAGARMVAWRVSTGEWVAVTHGGTPVPLLESLRARRFLLRARRASRLCVQGASCEHLAHARGMHTPSSRPLRANQALPSPDGA